MGRKLKAAAKNWGMPKNVPSLLAGTDYIQRRRGTGSARRDFTGVSVGRIMGDSKKLVPGTHIGSRLCRDRPDRNLLNRGQTVRLSAIRRGVARFVRLLVGVRIRIPPLRCPPPIGIRQAFSAVAPFVPRTEDALPHFQGFAP